MTEASAASTVSNDPVFTKDDFIPMAYWGKNHWSLLAYIETVMVDMGGFHVGFDPHMSQNRRNYRIMQEMNPRPKRAKSSNSMGLVMKDEWSTILNNGQKVIGHDDWCSLQDLANEGLLTAEAFEPKDMLHLSEKGRAIADRLRAHKSAGGNFAAFRG
jgi:hypothetical protein